MKLDTFLIVAFVTVGVVGFLGGKKKVSQKSTVAESSNITESPVEKKLKVLDAAPVRSVSLPARLQGKSQVAFTESKAKANLSKPTAKIAKPGTILQKKEAAEAAKAKQKKAVKDLAREIQKRRMDAYALNKRAAEMSEDQFLKSLPMTVSSAYQAVSDASRELSGSGSNPAPAPAGPGNSNNGGSGAPSGGSSTSAEGYAKWEEREEELKTVTLSEETQTVVNDVSAASEATQRDLEKIVASCLGEKPCIERSVMLLMDSNHRLSPQHFAFLEQYL